MFCIKTNSTRVVHNNSGIKIQAKLTVSQSVSEDCLTKSTMSYISRTINK